MMDKLSNKCRSFQVGDKVRTLTFSVKGTGWIEGEITEVLGNRHYTVKAGSQSLKRHIDQIISRMSYSDATPDHADIVIPVVPTANPVNSSTSAATTDHHVDENASPESTSSNVHSPFVDPDMSTAITPAHLPGIYRIQDHGGLLGLLNPLADIRITLHEHNDSFTVYS